MLESLFYIQHSQCISKDSSYTDYGSFIDVYTKFSALEFCSQSCNLRNIQYTNMSILTVSYFLLLLFNIINWNKEQHARNF